MGREGPCFHCGIEYTPLWRCGPPEKPVLCNACGSRWRTRGTLHDYTPKHALNPSSIPNLQETPRFLSCIRPSHTLEKDLDAPVPPPVAKKRRSILEYHVLSPTERFHQQLCKALLDPEFAKELLNEDENALIIQRANHYIPDNEVGVGCVLIKHHPDDDHASPVIEN